MLISEPCVLESNPIGDLIAGVGGRSTRAKEIQTGVYEISHFNLIHSSDYDKWPDNLGNDIHGYGVCDSIEQLLEKCPTLENDPNRQFVISITCIVASDEPKEGGWRWSKWGNYIGDHKITSEYIYDELEISEVYVYHVYEKIS